MWQSGDHIVLRTWNSAAGQLAWAGPVTVVEDTPDCVALFMAVDTPIKIPVQLDGSPVPRELPYEERYASLGLLGDGVWHTEHRLLLARPGAAHAFSAFWNGVDWTFNGWYVDLMAPLQRTPLGFDSEDYVLDILIDADLRWSWKDEDEFAAAQRVGRFSAAQAAGIHAEAARVIALIEARAWPLDAGWERWRPDPAWERPSLPANWDAQGDTDAG